MRRSFNRDPTFPCASDSSICMYLLLDLFIDKQLKIHSARFKMPIHFICLLK